LIEIGSKTAEKNSAQTNRQRDRHYENNGHLAVNQKTGASLGRVIDSGPPLRVTEDARTRCRAPPAGATYVTAAAAAAAARAADTS